MSYKPKFSPALYLKFLNSKYYYVYARDLTNTVVCRFWPHQAMVEFSGESVEECLDQVIINTGFDKIPEYPV